MRTPCLLIALMGCGFSGSTGFDPDAAKTDGPVPDAMWPSGVDFLPVAEEAFVDVDWTIDADTLINTTTATSNRLLPAGATLSISTQDGGAEIAILRVGSLKVNAGRTLSVQGTRPFAILANEDLTLDGAIDVGAQGAVAGPGGGSGGTGLGAGGIAKRDDGTGSGYDDAGAGGGGFGTMGGAGGKAGPFAGGGGGATFSITNQLRGGGSGGLAATCTNRPGGGGGALLVYSKTKITLNASASINAGGGGGEGGITACTGGAGPGAGGGAGGAIWLHAKEIEGDGLLAANGGGGGGASYFGLPNGGNGGDGKPSVTMVAVGGAKAPNSVDATAGGNGAIQGTAPSMVPDLLRGNGGGGGGGLGRIVVHTQKLSPTLQSSPTAVPAP